MKEVVKIAIRVPQWFVRVNTPRPDEKGRATTRPN